MKKTVYRIDYYGKSYIGQTNNLERRLKEHRREWKINLFGGIVEGLVKVFRIFSSENKKRVDTVEKGEIYKALENGDNLTNKRY